MPSDKFHLNGARIDRPALDKFPVLVAEGLGLSQRHAFLLQRKIVQALQAPAISHGKSLAVVLTGEFEPSDYWDLLDSEGLKGYTKEPTTFGQQTFKMRRRLLGAIVGHHGRQQNIFQEGFLAFYEYTQNGSVFHKSLRITVLEDVEYYRLFLEPGCNVLYPLISLDPEMVMGQGRNLRVLEIPPSDDRWGGGFLGFLIGVEEPSVINEREEFFLIEVQTDSVSQFARLKRTRRSKTTYLVPSDFVLIQPSYELLVHFNHLRGLRDRTLLRPSERLRQIREWYQKLFPNDLLSAGDKLATEVKLDFSLIEPVEYYGQQDQETPALFYPDNPLRFGPTQPGNIEISDPYQGLRQYGPWDLRLREQPRPVSSIHPYIIRPKDEELGWKMFHLFRYLGEGGYIGDIKASRYDRSFRGFKREFRVPFQMPGKEDSVPDCETDEEYLSAADAIIERWTASDGDPSRIALVVFPFDQEDSLEDLEFSKELYPRLKQKFIRAGLPSQMIDRSTLENIQFRSERRDRGASLCFDGQSYFGHILWNLALNIYVKMGGRPWTLQRELDNVNCLIGLSFTVNTLRPDHPMYVGIANIFDEFGEWVDITPDQRELSDMELKAWYESPYLFYSQETASSKLPGEFTSAVIRKSVQSYKNRRGRDPLNIVIHKSGPIYQVEMEGILHGIKATGTPLPEITIGFVSLIQNHGFRMYGEPDSDWRDSCVVRRGVMCTLEADRILLATTGRTETSSHVLSTPQPLEIRVERPSPEGLESVGLDRVNQYSDAQLCEQLMALTQLHWGSMRREIRLPVTVLYSQKVASLSARAEITSLQEGRVHRPWFI
jgi:hypothetical protein